MGTIRSLYFVPHISVGGGMVQQLRMLAGIESKVYTEGIEWSCKRTKQIMEPRR